MLYKKIQLIQDFVQYQYEILFQKEDLKLIIRKTNQINIFSLPIKFVFKKNRSFSLFELNSAVTRIIFRKLFALLT